MHCIWLLGFLIKFDSFSVFFCTMSYLLYLSDSYLVVLSSSVPCDSFKVEIGSKAGPDSD